MRYRGTTLVFVARAVQTGKRTAQIACAREGARASAVD
jgi:hypothetical protein